ncbi:MAG: DUF1987 domain-containing protein [Cyclobacteriaceae bacterium]
MKFLIEQSRVTPFVEYNGVEKTLQISGRSSPENPLIFYKRLVDFVDEFASSNESILIVNVSMEYLNTSSTKCIFNLFKKMSEVNDETDKIIIVNWYYEDWDDDMLEIGEDFSYCLKIQFNLSEVDDINSLTMEAA